jgi:hypothetical protein
MWCNWEGGEIFGHADATLNAMQSSAGLAEQRMMLAAFGFSYINLNRIPQAIPRSNARRNFCPTITCAITA